jgi:UTP--glucose-1-phosphate uridylyltransferase
MPITKAVITCAGFGTRFLPISKTIQKEMLPILNRPILDYVVEDCVKAGIKEIIIVMNEHNYQPLHFYRENQRLYKYLEKKGKLDLYQQVENLHQKARFTFVKQSDNDPYGTSVPIQLAQKHVENEEAFLYLTGDDFVFFRDPNRSLIKELIELYYASQADGVITCIERPEAELYRYGVAEMQNNNGFNYLKTFVEKPAPGTAPSNLANVSKYVLTPKIFPLIDQQQPDPKTGEYYITDIVLQQAQQGKIVVKNGEGYFLNSGDPQTWLKANLLVASQNPEFKADLEKFWQEITN